MWNKVLIIVVLTIVFCSTCGVNSKLNNRSNSPCNRQTNQKYSNISFSLFDLIIRGDTSQINEVKYECGSSAFIVSKTIYDNFGKWDKIVELENKRKLLVWDSLVLWPNAGPNTIMTSNFEGRSGTYGSFMALSSIGDELSYSSENRDSLISIVTRLMDATIEVNDTSLFYKDFWMEVDPKRWFQMENYRKNNKNLEENWWR